MKYYMMSAGAIFAVLGLLDVPDASFTSCVCLGIAMTMEAFKYGRTSCAG